MFSQFCGFLTTSPLSAFGDIKQQLIHAYYVCLWAAPPCADVLYEWPQAPRKLTKTSEANFRAEQSCGGYFPSYIDYF